MERGHKHRDAFDRFRSPGSDRHHQRIARRAVPSVDCVANNLPLRLKEAEWIQFS
jgi:hypothetical protein